MLRVIVQRLREPRVIRYEFFNILINNAPVAFLPQYPLICQGSGPIKEFTGIGTGSVNDTVTSGAIFSISGRKLKLAGDDPSIGVYFVSSKDPANEVKVTARLALNSGGKLIGTTPQLASGFWRVAVKPQFNGSSSSVLKKPRIMTSRFELNAGTGRE